MSEQQAPHRLMAYVDRWLSPGETAQVERLIERDSGALDLVDAFRRGSESIRRAFSQPMHEMPPLHLVDAIDAQHGRVLAMIEQLLAETVERQRHIWKAHRNDTPD